MKPDCTCSSFSIRGAHTSCPPRQTAGQGRNESFVFYLLMGAAKQKRKAEAGCLQNRRGNILAWIWPSFSFWTVQSLFIPLPATAWDSLLHSITKILCQDCQVTVPLRNKNNRKPEQVERMAWCLSGGIFPNWCHCCARVCAAPQHNPILDELLSSCRLCEQSSSGSTSHGKQTRCRVGCFTGEVCHIQHNLTDTKFNKSRSGSRGSSSCCMGWDCQLRSFWIQRQVCVPANQKRYGLTWSQSQPTTHSVKYFGLRNHLEEGVNNVHLCVSCNKIVPGQLPCQLRITHPPLLMINQMSGCMCSPSISSHGKQQHFYKCRKKEKKRNNNRKKNYFYVYLS